MEQKKVWDAIAEGWTHWRNKPMKETIDFAIKIRKGKKKLKVLDIGCGNCRNLIPFAGHQLHGVDFSKKMIQEGKKICDKEGLDIEFKLTQVRKIPYTSDYFDVILCTSVLQCLEKDRGKTVNEIFRVLKPGGVGLFSTWYKPSRREEWLPWKRRKMEYLRYYYYFKEGELRDLLESAGFKITKLFKNLKKSEKTGKWNRNMFTEVKKPL